MGPNRNYSGGRLMFSNDVRQNRRPTLLPSHISRGLISRLRLRLDRHRGRIQPCSDAFSNLRLSPNCQASMTDYLNPLPENLFIHYADTRRGEYMAKAASRWSVTTRFLWLKRR